MLNGIFLGLGAAVFQSTSYVGSRVFAHRYPDKPLHLLSLSHIVMGIFALMMLPFVWPNTMPAFAAYGPSLIACSGFYLIGQWLLFAALKKASASRVSPLLGIKVFILALIGVLFLGQRFGLLQWTAIMMSVAAAVMLSRTGEKLSLRVAIWIFLTCVAYCFSDINIKILVGHFNYLGFAHSAILSGCLSYILCGIIAAVLLPFVAQPTTTMFVYSLPFAAEWFVAMLLLYACFGIIGVVYGNIVQSSRGIISIMFGAALVKLNYEHLDQKVSRGVFFQRLAAAILMSCAIALYYLEA
jgi:drug/metabolite transporter (DMT)-like permease